MTEWLCVRLQIEENGFNSRPNLNERNEMKTKKRNEIVNPQDRNQVWSIPNGKGYVKRQLSNPRYVGLKWGDRVKTRKPCTSGADKQAKARQRMRKQKKTKK